MGDTYTSAQLPGLREEGTGQRSISTATSGPRGLRHQGKPSNLAPLANMRSGPRPVLSARAVSTVTSQCQSEALCSQSHSNGAWCCVFPGGCSMTVSRSSGWKACNAHPAGPGSSAKAPPLHLHCQWEDQGGLGTGGKRGDGLGAHCSMCALPSQPCAAPQLQGSSRELQDPRPSCCL
jgi:hypothetical protein